MPEPGAGQALVQNLYLSIDPTNRAWIGEEPTYLPPVGIGEVMRTVGLGRVIASNTDGYPEGALVTGLIGWQDYVVAGERRIPLTVGARSSSCRSSACSARSGSRASPPGSASRRSASRRRARPSWSPRPRGAVGSVAGQIAKLRGARVVGIAGGAEKCAWLVDELGLRRGRSTATPPTGGSSSRAACPDGVDVDFENVGGEIMDAVFAMLNLNARVALCGLISEYNDRAASRARPAAACSTNRVPVKGFIVLDYFDRFPEAIAQLGALGRRGQAEGPAHDRRGTRERARRRSTCCSTARTSAS